VKIQVYQALCGENPKKAYDLLKTNFPDKDIAKNLAFKTGLQDNVQGTKWDPQIRGFFEGEYFLLMKTFPDRSSDVRPGRVFSHTLILPADQICECVSLNAFFSILPQEMDKNSVLENISVDCSISNETLTDTNFKGRFNKVIHGLVNHHKYKNTIIWVGQKDMSNATNELWKLLTPSERKTFNFGIYFDAENISGDKLNLITVPESIHSKFLSKEFLLINKNENYLPSGLAEEILAGNINAKNRLEIFRKELNLSDLTRSELDLIAVVLPTMENLNSITDIKKVNTLGQIIALHAPNPQTGKNFKNKLIDRLVTLIENSNSSDLTVLRNFKLECFLSANEKMGKAVQSWVNKYILNTKKADLNESLGIINLLNTDKKSWISINISKKIGESLGILDSEKAKLIWRWLLFDPSYFDTVQQFVSQTSANETILIATKPKKIDKSNVECAINAANKKRWFRLNAHLLLSIHLPEKALEMQLSVDKDPESMEGLLIIAKKVEQSKLVAIAIKISDPRILKILSMLHGTSALVLDNLDLSDPSAQKLIILFGEDHGNSNWLKNGKRSKKAVKNIFDCLISGTQVELRLLEDIAESEFSDVLDYDQRNALWEKLPGIIRSKILESTSTKLLGKLAKDPATKVPDDKILSEFILSNGISGFLYYNNDKLKNTLPIFNRYKNIPDHYLTDYLRNYRGDLNSLDAKQLGKLIYNRSNRDAAHLIYQKSSRDNNWRFALVECHSILDRWTRFKIAGKGIIKGVKIPSDDWWTPLGEFIVEYYSNRNALVTVWRKAGGQESDLLMDGSALDAWNNALSKLRHGALKKPKMKDLLSEINKDYGHIEDFRLLYDLRHSFIKK